MRICLVAPRSLETSVGGAERLLRDYAHHLQARGHEVTVFSTCAVNHFTWANELPAGEHVVEGLRTVRFPVSVPGDPVLMSRLNRIIAAGLHLPVSCEDEWVRHTGYSEALLRAIADAATAIEAFVFAPYLFASTVFGARVCPEKSVIVPCLHDEAYARFAPIQDTLRSCAGLLFNSRPEAVLSRMLVGPLATSRVVGSAVDLPPSTDPSRFRDMHRLTGPVFSYAGRREAGKNFPLLLEGVTAFNQGCGRSGPATLVLMGTGPEPVPEKAAAYVCDIGLASEGDKLDAFAASTAVINLSSNESLSYVVLEAWACSAPVIVNARCAVTRYLCEQSGGGLWVESIDELCAAMDRMIDDEALARELGRRGRDYLAEHYSWPVIVPRLEAALQAMV